MHVGWGLRAAVPEKDTPPREEECLCPHYVRIVLSMISMACFGGFKHHTIPGARIVVMIVCARHDTLDDG
jgi:hypothetical protein